jgi:hypothetical protein
MEKVFKKLSELRPLWADLLALIRIYLSGIVHTIFMGEV